MWYNSAMTRIEICSKAGRVHAEQLQSTFIERFWNRVNKGSENECWIWTGYLNSDGYGRAKRHGKADGVHRISWELSNGKVPEPLQVLHKCDNPRCVNPKHLFLGTPADNVIDCISKNRRRYANGETHHKARLSDSEILEIHRLYKSGIPTLDIAKQFGVNRNWINLVLSGKRRPISK